MSDEGDYFYPTTSSATLRYRQASAECAARMLAAAAEISGTWEGSVPTSLVRDLNNAAAQFARIAGQGPNSKLWGPFPTMPDTAAELLDLWDGEGEEDEA